MLWLLEDYQLLFPKLLQSKDHYMVYCLSFCKCLQLQIQGNQHYYNYQNYQFLYQDIKTNQLEPTIIGNVL